MKQMHVCPMMMQHMPMMNMPMGMQTPQMQMAPMQMMQPMMMCNIYFEMDDMDEEYLMGMYSESCHKMMPYINKVLDKAEEKSDMMYAETPDKDMIKKMSDEAFKGMMKDMPELADEMSGKRQQFGHDGLAKDLLTVLLLQELLRRRRRRRRFDHGGHFGGSPFGF